MTDQLRAHVPPQGNRPVYRRLARSYGPLALAALALILMALLIPTRSTEAPADPDPGGSGENGLVVDPTPPEERLR